MKLPIVMCIDIEPDDRQLQKSPPGDWVGFERSAEFFNELRIRLEAATGSPARFSWFLRMDPQIAHSYGSAAWAATRYTSLIRSLEQRGDAFGLHIHAWRWNETADKWEIDFADQDWVNHCVRTGFDAFREGFKRPCRMFRFGDRWLNNPTVGLIRKLGAKFDLTLEPGQPLHPPGEPVIGVYPDCRNIPRRPFRASRDDFRTPGDSWFGRGICMIPLSVGSANLSPQLFTPAGKTPAPEAASRSEAQTVSHNGMMNGRYEGWLDRVDSESISGWAYDQECPEAPVEVEIYDDTTPLAKVKATKFRPDLLSAGKGDGAHSFYIPVPAWLKDGNSHTIRAKVAGADEELKNSPAELHCEPAGSTQEYRTLNLSYDSWLMCRLIDELLNDEQTSYLAMIVRSDVMIHADQFTNLKQTFDHILSHPRIGQMVFETPAGMMSDEYKR